jgi:hypothetical protein
MGLLDGLNPVKDIEPCKVTKTVLSLESDDATILVNALDDERWTSTGLGNELRKRGLILSPDTIRTHREKSCKCYRI